MAAAEALEQVEVADEVGIDVAWAVEHHFLEEYSHCSAPEVFLSACAAAPSASASATASARRRPPITIRPAPPSASPPWTSHLRRLELGIGEGATRLELCGFGIGAKQKRAMSLEAGEQIANMMAMSPYPGFEGEFFSMPCRDVIPKPVQKPHPPMWIACTNRTTIELAARLGLGALAFAFVDPAEARHWAEVYYDIIRSDECVPLGHSVNANIAVVTGFSLHEDRAEAIRRGFDGFHFFAYALRQLVVHHTIPGHSNIWDRYEAQRGSALEDAVAAALDADDGYSDTIGTPADAVRWLKEAEDARIDHVIFLQQGGKNRHEDICASLRLFGSDVLGAFSGGREEREAAKAEELAPYIEKALARKERMRPLRATRCRWWRLPSCRRGFPPAPSADLAAQIGALLPERQEHAKFHPARSCRTEAPR